MVNRTRNPFKKNQLKAILRYRSNLQKIVKRDVSLSEAIINWIALGYAEEYRDLFYVQES